MSGPSSLQNFQLTPYTVTPVLDVAAYASGDVLFVPTFVPLVPGINPSQSLRIEINDIVVLDKSAQAGLLDLVFFTDLPTTFGALNAAVGLSSADLLLVRRAIPVTSYNALKAATNGLAQPDFPSFTLQMPAGAKGFYLGAISRDAKTYGASDLVIIVGGRCHNFPAS